MGLFVGCEGTLGVVTEVTLRLRPAPAGTPRTVVGAFPDLVLRGRPWPQITRRGLIPPVLELLDRACLEAVEEWKHLGIDADAAALLLARVDTPGDSGAAEASAIAATMTAAGALWAEQSTDDAEAEALFDAGGWPTRHSNGWPGAHRGRVRAPVPGARKLEQIERDRGPARRVDRHVAHAGDGNLHPRLITRPAIGRPAAASPRSRSSRRGHRAGRTVTGEHGVGILKRDGMCRELDPGALALQDAVRRALDPREIFNPGKGQ